MSFNWLQYVIGISVVPAAPTRMRDVRLVYHVPFGSAAVAVAAFAFSAVNARG